MLWFRRGGESFGFADTHAGEDAETGSPGQTHKDFALRHILKLACNVSVVFVN